MWNEEQKRKQGYNGKTGNDDDDWLIAKHDMQ